MASRDDWYYEVVARAQNHKQILAAVRLYPSLEDGRILDQLEQVNWIDDLTRQVFKRAYLAAVPIGACASA
jgi:hypothetical protein